MAGRAEKFDALSCVDPFVESIEDYRAAKRVFDPLLKEQVAFTLIRRLRGLVGIAAEAIKDDV